MTESPTTQTIRCILFLAFAMAARAGLAIDDSVPAIRGDFSRTHLGDGTGIVIGIVDSGVDSAHPALAGNDSQGNPRLVAQANFVTTEPGNTGDDAFGHGTWVASAALSHDSTYTGLASDARFVNARVLNNSNGFPNGSQVMNGVGFAIDQGADVLNLSLNFFAPNSSGNTPLDRMLDWAAYDRGIGVTVIAGNIFQAQNNTETVRSPASAYNALAVGRTIADFSRVHTDSAIAPTADGRAKPDVVAPGTGLTLANDDWEGGSLWDSGLSGTSFAAPQVAGMMAQQLGYGAANALSTSPLVVKATMLNSSLKVPDKSGNAWEPADSSRPGGVLLVNGPLDSHSGAGQINGERLFSQYSAGQHTAGLVGATGWDLAMITDTETIEYVIDPELSALSELNVTLTWARHVGRTDDGDGIVDVGDTFTVLEAVDNLNLKVLFNGSLLATSQSTIDNVEHLHLALTQQGEYAIRVSRLAVANSGNDEQFALAWSGTAVPVPEPSTLTLLWLGMSSLFVWLGMARRGRRR